jgi:hypothetical protein
MRIRSWSVLLVLCSAQLNPRHALEPASLQFLRELHDDVEPPAEDASARARASATSTGSTSPAAAPRGSTPHDGSPCGAVSFTDDAESCAIVKDASSAPGFRFRRREA